MEKEILIRVQTLSLQALLRLSYLLSCCLQSHMLAPALGCIGWSIQEMTSVCRQTLRTFFPLNQSISWLNPTSRSIHLVELSRKVSSFRIRLRRTERKGVIPFLEKSWPWQDWQQTSLLDWQLEWDCVAGLLNRSFSRLFHHFQVKMYLETHGYQELLLALRHHWQTWIRAWGGPGSMLCAGDGQTCD